MKIRGFFLALLLLVATVATVLAQGGGAHFSPQTGRSGREAITSAPRFATPKDFGAYADVYNFPALRFGLPFVIESGATRYGQATSYALNGTIASTNGVATWTLTVPIAAAPPVNLAYTDTVVKWRIKNASVYTTGCNCTFLSATPAAVPDGSGNIVYTFNAPTPNATFAGAGTVIIGEDMAVGLQTQGNSSVAYGGTVTTTTVAMNIFNGIPQIVLDAAQRAGDLTYNTGSQNTTINVSKVVVGAANTFSGNALNAALDIGSMVQISGAGAAGGLYAPNTVAGYNGGYVVAEGTDGATLYVYPPVQTQLTAANSYVLASPYLFASVDAGSGAVPAKYLGLSGVGACPSAKWVGTCELVSQIATYIDPFNVTLTTAASASQPATVATPVAWGRQWVGFDDTAAVIKAHQAAAKPTNTLSAQYVGIPNVYAMATLASGTTGATSLFRAIRVGEGQLIMPQVFGLPLTVAPLALSRAPTDQPQPYFDPTQVLSLCNQVIAGGQPCRVRALANSQGTPFTNGPSQIDNQNNKLGRLLAQQLGSTNVDFVNLGVGGAQFLDLDPQGASGGLPSQRALLNWYTQAGTSTPWINIVRNGLAIGTANATFAGCPHVLLLGPFTNTDGFTFVPGAVEDVIAITKGASWLTACGFSPAILFATDGYQPLGEPLLGLGNLWAQSNYSSLVISGLAGGSFLVPGYEKTTGMAANVSRTMRIMADGDDVLNRPLYQTLGAPSQSNQKYTLPYTAPDPIDDFSFSKVINFAPGGVCTLVTVTVLANNVANASCIWGLLNNELDLTIGNPNGTQNAASPFWSSQWAHSPQNNQVRLLYNASANAYGDGAAQGMISAEVDLYNDVSVAAVANGTSGTPTVTCTVACINWQYLNAVVTDNQGRIPANTCVQTMNAAGTSITLKVCGSDPISPTASNLSGGNIVSGTLTFKKVIYGPFSTGQYGFVCPTQLNVGGNLASLIPTFEVRGNSLLFSLCGNLMVGSNLFQLENVPRFGGAFQYVLSTPAGSPATVSLKSNGTGGIGPDTSRESWPWIAQFMPTVTLEGLYGDASSDNVASLVSQTGASVCDGQQGNHRGGCGSKIEEVAYKGFNARAPMGNAATLNVTANSAIVTIPPGRKLRAIYIQNTTANAVTGGVNIGTTALGADVVSAAAVAANALVTIQGATLLKTQFGTLTAPVTQQLFISAVTAWNSANVHVFAEFDP